MGWTSTTETRPRLPSAAVAALVLVSASSAAAAGDVQPSAPGELTKGHQSRASTHGRWSPDVGAGWLHGLSSVEERDGDLVSTTQLRLGELALSALYQVPGPLGVGARASWGTELGQRGVAASSGGTIDLDRSLWQVSLAARYQVTRGRSWALGGNAGAAAMSDSMGNESVTQWAPVVAASAGYDFRLASSFGLGLELRASHAWFSESGRALVAAGQAAVGATTFRYREFLKKLAEDNGGEYVSYD